MGLEDGAQRDGILLGVSIGAGVLLMACIICLAIACHQRVKLIRLRNEVGSQSVDEEEVHCQSEFGSNDEEEDGPGKRARSLPSISEAVTAKTSPSSRSSKRGSTIRHTRA